MVETEIPNEVIYLCLTYCSIKNFRHILLNLYAFSFSLPVFGHCFFQPGTICLSGLILAIAKLSRCFKLLTILMSEKVEILCLALIVIVCQVPLRCSQVL